jgi:hypothetical protein
MQALKKTANRSEEKKPTNKATISLLSWMPPFIQACKEETPRQVIYHT